MSKLLLLMLGIAGSLHPQDGASIPWGERLEEYLHRTYSRQRLTLLVAETGLDHLLGEPREWGRDPQTYTYRYSAAFGRRLVRNSIELGLGAAFNEDTRFRPSRGHGLKLRLRSALIQAVSTSTKDDQHFAYSRLGATVGGLLIASRWDPCPMSPQRFFESVASGYIGHLENSLLAEFSDDMKAFGKRMRARFFRRPPPVQPPAGP